MNPNNNITLYGNVVTKPKVISDSNGTEFAIMFEMAVKRNYKNIDGKYLSDFFKVKYCFNDENRREFAHKISKGNYILVAGALRQEKNFTYVMSEDISFDVQTRAEMNAALEERFKDLDERDFNESEIIANEVSNNKVIVFPEFNQNNEDNETSCALPY